MSVKQELVSIIIPLYNKEKYIEQTIENIKKQTYSNWELIIVDDKSTDKSLDIVKKYKNEKIIIMENKKNYGAAKSRNTGLKYATGRYICFQDADDFWNKRKLEKQVKFMKKNGCAFSYTGFSFITDDGNIIKTVNIQDKLEYKEALKNTRILTSATMFDIEKIDKKLLEMPDIKSEDIATWWNILKKGYIAYGINESLVYYRKTKNSLTSNKLRSAKNRWYIYRKYENFHFFKSLYYFIYYIIYAIIKRM